MTVDQIAQLGRKLLAFLHRFRDCFGRSEPRKLLRAYVQGQLSALERKSVEPIALAAGIAPRTLQRFLESIRWDEEQLRDDCQVTVAQEHADPEALGIIDESGVPKSGDDTAGVARQWCGRTGKVDNCVVAVHASYVASRFQCLLDTDLYLPESWTQDLPRREKAHVPQEVPFRTKPQIALELIWRILGHGIRVAAWVFDELYGRDSKFLDALDQWEQNYVAEVPADFHGWLRTPRVLTHPPKNARRRGRRKKYPRLARQPPACEVQNLVKYSDVFRKQAWQPFHVKDTQKGPVVWEVKWARFWRKRADGLPSQLCCLIVARNVLNPQEVKYFVANQVPGERRRRTAGPDDSAAAEVVTLTWLLWVAFRRWPVEQCFRQTKNELGMDHFEVRGWRCIRRHYFICQLSYLFCARMRQEFATMTEEEGSLTVEQVQEAMDVWLDVIDLPPAIRQARLERQAQRMRYHQRRNAQAKKSHTKTRLQQLQALGIVVNELESCVPSDTS